MTRTPSSRFALACALPVVLSLAACGDTADAPADAPPVAPVATVDAPVEAPRYADAAAARRAMLEGDPAEREAATDAYVGMADLGDMRSLSSMLWAGNGLPRDRKTSARIALAGYEREPQPWSTLRAGIALVNGLGVEADPARAVEVLGHEVLATSSAAPYYQSKAYQKMGDTERAREAMARAAELGNARAAKELEEL